MNWVWSHLPTIWDLTVAHVCISAVPILLGFVISVPLGYWASRSRTARSVLLIVGNIAYTIPALALIVLIPALLGLPLITPTNTVVALTLYAIALMVRTGADAFAAVSPDIRQSATAIGYSGVQRFFAVELPLAGPVLLAGIRVVSVSTVSLVTVGALVGVINLGDLFTEGFQRAFYTEIITGIVAVLVVAAVFDLILNLVGRALMPWNHRNRSKAARRPVVTVAANA